MIGFCDVCGSEKKGVSCSRRSGKLVCRACYRKDPSTHEECSSCGEIKVVAKRTDSGQAVCHACYRKGNTRYHDKSTHEECSSCGEVKAVQTRTDSGQAVCYACYQNNKVEECLRCREVKVIQALGLCRRCYARQRRAKLASA